MKSWNLFRICQAAFENKAALMDRTGPWVEEEPLPKYIV
jgi:hypothetical protein